MKNAIFILMVTFFCIGLQAQTKSDSLYKVYNIVLNTPTGDIRGTITMPVNKVDIPVVLIIPGSGNTDKDGNSINRGIRNEAYKMLSHELGANGIASLRYDKRGVGSSIRYDQNTNPVIEDYVTDAVAWVNYLRQEPAFSKIVMIGHGEGSLVAMIVAQRKTKTSGIISLEGAGHRADFLLRQQLSKLPKEDLAESDKILDSLIAGKQVDSVSNKLMPVFNPAIQPYLISWIKYDPAAELAKIKIPVLLIQGSTDLQVPVDNINILGKAKPDAQMIIIDRMNYVLKESSSDPYENYSALKKSDLPLHKDLVPAIVKFINTIPNLNQNK